jgi:isorenieratene synthase
MRNPIERWIMNRMGGYRQRFNAVDERLPRRLAARKAAPPRVAVVGAGIAGLTAAAALGERGFPVALFEREEHLGGKMGAWPVTLGRRFKTGVEHGFHAFFRQYYNLRRFMEKTGSLGHLVPIADYQIATPQKRYSFRGVGTAPVLNMLSMARHKIYRLGDMVKNRKAAEMLAFLRYDAAGTFERYDETSFAQFAERIGLPDSLRIVFNTFTRSFFAENHLMSMAEVIKSFHYYYLSNDLGLLYDFLDDDFDVSFLQPARWYLESQGVEVRLGEPVKKLERKDGGFAVGRGRFDYLVLATDVRAARTLAESSPFIGEESRDTYRQLASLKPSQRYAVLRLWLDRRQKQDLPPFLSTDRVRVLDSITVYHEAEKSSRKWAEETGGGIFELHSYAVPDDITQDREIRDRLIAEMRRYLPELAEAKILHEHLQVRSDFTAFHTGLYRTRPRTATGVKNLLLAGDWVKLPVPAMLMEAACTSGLLAANEILGREGLQQEPVYTVPLRGLLARRDGRDGRGARRPGPR